MRAGNRGSMNAPEWKSMGADAGMYNLFATAKTASALVAWLRFLALFSSNISNSNALLPFKFCAPLCA